MYIYIYIYIYISSKCNNTYVIIGMSAKFVNMYRIKRNRRTSLKQITLRLSAICLEPMLEKLCSCYFYLLFNGPFCAHIEAYPCQSGDVKMTQ